MQRNSIVVNSEEVKENYMTLPDLKGISRELLILNNTAEFHKNYHICQSNSEYLSMYRFELDQQNKVMLRTNYKKKKCYNSIFLIKETKDRQDKIVYDLIQSSFREHKDNNYVEAVLDSGEYYVVVYNSYPQENKISYNLTVFGSDSFINVTPNTEISQIIDILRKTFIQ